ncbi:hypothetical protein SLA2020_455720 [Shorea laevis]
MGTRKILPSASAASHTATSSSSPSQPSLTAGKLCASSTHSNNTHITSDPSSFVPNPHSLHQFLTKQRKSGAITLDEALHFFDYMIRMHPTRPISSFNHLFGALAKIKHHHHVISCYSKLNSISLFPDFRTFNILLNCSCYMGRISDGFLVLGKILRSGYSPNTVTFTALIRGLCMKDKIG